MAKTPVAWMTPSDMKIFLRPQGESLMTLLCFVVTICCELTDFRQTSFGSTYMTLLGFAQIMHVTMPIQHATDETSAVFMKRRKVCASHYPRKSYERHLGINAWAERKDGALSG